MKKIYVILFILFCFSCEDDITNNTPTFQALVNGSNEWIAENYTVSIQNNQLSISGANQTGVISIVVDSPQVDQYNLYSWTDNFAVFQDTLQYSTQNDGVGSVAYLSDGFVQIQEIDNLNNTISGNFNLFIF